MQMKGSNNCIKQSEVPLKFLKSSRALKPFSLLLFVTTYCQYLCIHCVCQLMASSENFQNCYTWRKQTDKDFRGYML